MRSVRVCISLIYREDNMKIHNMKIVKNLFMQKSIFVDMKQSAFCFFFLLFLFKIIRFNEWSLFHISLDIINGHRNSFCTSIYRHFFSGHNGTQLIVFFFFRFAYQNVYWGIDADSKHNGIIAQVSNNNNRFTKKKIGVIFCCCSIVVQYDKNP